MAFNGSVRKKEEKYYCKTDCRIQFTVYFFFFFFLVGYLRFPMSPNEEGCLIQAPGDMFPIRKRYQNFIPEKNDRSVQ